MCLRTLAWLPFLALMIEAAEVPPAAQLLPTDTLALVSVPDWNKAVASWNQSAQGKLWQDPAIKPLKEKLMERWVEQIGPLERQLGIQLADYADLVQGQVTLAVIQNGWGGQPDARPGVLLLVDARDKRQALQTRLAEFKRKWTESGRRLRTEKIRDVDCTTLIVAGGDVGTAVENLVASPKDQDADLDEPLDLPDKPKAAEKSEIIFGQSGSLLLVSNNANSIEKVLARQAGSPVSALAEQSAYASSQNGPAHDGIATAWLDFARVFATFQKQLTEPTKGAKGDSLLGARPDRVLQMTGLGGITTMAGRLSAGPEGTGLEVRVGLPDAQRRGLFSVFSSEKKDAGPPVFVGADVVKFSRWRLEGPKVWSTVESLFAALAPDVAGLVQMGLQAAGKERDPNFDLKKTLLGSLGDDFIFIRRSSRPPTNRGNSSASPLYLVGSPTPDQFVHAVKAASGLMPLAGGESDVREREFLGRRIYSIALSPGLMGGPAAAPGSPSLLNFAGSAGYAALSTDTGVLEEYLRSVESAGKPLRDVPGFSEAAQRVEGTGGIYFGYENQVETLRAWLADRNAPMPALGVLPSLGSILGSKLSATDKNGKSTWLEPSLVPPFERLSKYFSFVVSSLHASHEGLSWHLFAPAPPPVAN